MVLFAWFFSLADLAKRLTRTLGFIPDFLSPLISLPPLLPSSVWTATRNITHTQRPALPAATSLPATSLLGWGAPADPAPGHDAPDLDLAAPQVVELEALHLGLLALSALLPRPDLLLRAVPLGNDTHVVRLANLDRVLGVHGAMLALELGVADGDDVAWTDHVIVLRRSVAHVRVD